MGTGGRRCSGSSGLWHLQPPTAMAQPGQAQVAMKLETLLWTHQGKSPNFQKFSFKERGKKKKKKKKRGRFFHSEGNQRVSCLLGLFPNRPTVLYKRLCNPFLGGRECQFKLKSLTISEKYQKDILQPFTSSRNSPPPTNREI